jgi:hypothetical protein
MADENEHHDLWGPLPELRTTEDLIGLFDTSGEAHSAEPIFNRISGRFRGSGVAERNRIDPCKPCFPGDRGIPRG